MADDSRLENSSINNSANISKMLEQNPYDIPMHYKKIEVEKAKEQKNLMEIGKLVKRPVLESNEEPLSSRSQDKKEGLGQMLNKGKPKQTTETKEEDEEEVFKPLEPAAPAAPEKDEEQTPISQVEKEKLLKSMSEMFLGGNDTSAINKLLGLKKG